MSFFSHGVKLQTQGKKETRKLEARVAGWLAFGFHRHGDFSEYRSYDPVGQPGAGPRVSRWW